MSFQIRNTTVDSAVNKVAFDNAPPITFPQLVSATAVLTAPVTTYESNLPLTEVGTSTNVTVNSDNMYNNIYGNYVINWSINITVPSATSESPVFLCPYIYYDDGGGYSYIYNTIQINNGNDQTFNFKNIFQNTWGSVHIYFQIGNNLTLPSFTLNSSTMNIVAVQSTSSDGGQNYND